MQVKVFEGLFLMLNSSEVLNQRDQCRKKFPIFHEKKDSSGKMIDLKN